MFRKKGGGGPFKAYSSFSSVNVQCCDVRTVAPVPCKYIKMWLQQVGTRL